MNSEVSTYLEELYVTNKYGIKYPNPEARPNPKLVEYYEKEYGIRTDVHRMCINCQIRHIEKYKEFSPSEKYKFDIDCTFVPKSLPITQEDIDKIAAQNSIEVEQAKKIILSAVDPVAWAELMLGFDDKDPDWRLRPYQKELIRCTSKRIGMIWGRRCVSAGTPINMADGTTKSIETIQPGEVVLCEKEGQQSEAVVSELFDNGEQELYRIAFDRGLFLDITENHPLYSKERNFSIIPDRGKYLLEPSYRSLIDGLKKGDKVALSLGCNKWGDVHDPELAGFLGYMITDGSCTKGQTPKFTNTNDLYLNEVQTFVENRWPDRQCKRYSKGNKNARDIIMSPRTDRKVNPIKLFFKDIGLFGKKAAGKTVPDLIWKLDKESVAYFLNRMWAGDGCISSYDKGRGRENDWAVEATLTSASKQLVFDLQKLLWRIGCYTKVQEEIRKSPASEHIGCYYKLRINDRRSISRFLQFTGPIYGKEKQSEKVLRLCLNAQSRYLQIDKDWDWLTIKGITSIGSGQTYDICVPESNSFIAKGIVNHNSGKSFGMAVKLVNQAFNFIQKAGKDSKGNQLYCGPQIYIVTPFQSQLTGIFNDIESLIKRNGELTSQVKGGHGGSLYVKSPLYHMEFKNGGSITGFVSGIGVKADGSAGGTMRGSGRGTPIMYLDEMDMIPEEIISKVIVPILHTGASGIMYATSTPIGKRGRFYKWTNESPKYKSDHYPSSVLPHWEQIEEEAKEESGTKENFMSEYMAVFTEGGYGVFKPTLVHAARADYTYSEVQADSYEFWSQKIGIADYKNLIISIGIDWNQNAGSEFFVSGYSHSTGRIVALESVNIPRSEFSARTWIDAVIKLNLKWKPSWIYADKGWGQHIIEELHYQAHQLKGKRKRTIIEEETIKLIDRLKAFDFAANVTLRSPVDGAKFEKSGKHFIVENAIRILEKGCFSYPEQDKQLTDQLLNYIVVRRHPSNDKPVYGCANAAVGDHRLDAMMLSLAAITLECSEFATGSIAMSSVFFKDRALNPGDYISSIQEAQEALKEAQRAGVPAILNILAIRRGDTPQDDEHIRREWNTKQSQQKRFKSDRERGTLRNPRQDKDNLLKRVINSGSSIQYRQRPIGTSKSQGRSNLRRGK